jgi:hypothetical protein
MSAGDERAENCVAQPSLPTAPLSVNEKYFYLLTVDIKTV